MEKKIKTENTKMQRTVTKQEKVVMPSERPSPGQSPETRRNAEAQSRITKLGYRSIQPERSPAFKVTKNAYIKK